MATIEFKIEKLSNNNYTTWSMVVQSQLKGKDLWDFVTESKVNSPEEIIKNEQAKTLIYSSMETNQIAATGVCRTAYDLWVKIKENHLGAETNSRSSSLAEFLSLEYKKNDNLISFAGRFEATLGRLQTTGHRIDEQTKIWVYSHTLPNSMKQTVNVFNMAKPDGTVTELISQLKIAHHLDAQEHDKAAAYQVRDNFRRFNGACTYCKKEGHMWRDTVRVTRLACVHILNISLNMYQAMQTLKDGVWNCNDFIGCEEASKTLGIISLGQIGQEVGERMRAFEMNVIGYNPQTPASVVEPLGTSSVTLDEIWKYSDYIPVHVPLLPATKHLRNRSTLSKCKQGVMIINFT